MDPRVINILRLTLALTDIILVNFSFFLGFTITEKYFGSIDGAIYNESLIAFNVLWLMAVSICKLYSENTVVTERSFYKATAKSVLIQAFLFIPYLMFSFNYILTTNFIIYSYSMLVFAFLMSRFTGAYFISLATKNPQLKSRPMLTLTDGLKKSSKHKAA
jgi:FlaA1/EpsC-like NDP-sugar epimerase